MTVLLEADAVAILVPSGEKTTSLILPLPCQYGVQRYGDLCPGDANRWPMQASYGASRSVVTLAPAAPSGPWLPADAPHAPISAEPVFRMRQDIWVILQVR